MKKAVFLDKDGTLIKDIPYNVDPSLIQWEKGAVEGLKRLKANGYLLIVISNQAGVAKGYFPEDALEFVKTKLQRELRPINIEIDDFFFCPHHPCGIVDKYAIRCTCRKPEPGMILMAASKHNIDLSQSWMIGDILHDVEAGNKAGCKTILIDNGNETEWQPGEHRVPAYKARDIEEAASIIVSKKVCVANEY